MKITQTFKITLLTIATTVAGHAAADSLAERRADSVPIGQWSQVITTNTSESANQMDMMGMMDREDMMKHCKQMHETFTDADTDDDSSSSGRRYVPLGLTS